jgi:hypothetical protein
MTEVYSGHQQVMEMVALSSGIDTRFSSGVVIFSPDGNHIGGGGKSVLAYSGRSGQVVLTPAGGGVDVQLPNGGINFSPDGKSLASGGHTVPAYQGPNHPVELFSVGAGVDTIFRDGSIYYSPNGRNLGGGGKTVVAYQGGQPVQEILPMPDGIDVLFSGGCLTFSPDGKNLAGGGHTTVLAGNVASLTSNDQGAVWVLTSSHVLEEQTPYASSCTPVAGDVQSFLMEPNGQPLVTAFSSTPYTDVKQGFGNACWLLSSVAAAAYEGVDLANRIHYLGSNVFQVALCNGSRGMTYQDVKFDGTTADYDPQGGLESEWVVLYQRATLQQLGKTAMDPWYATQALPLLTGTAASFHAMPTGQAFPQTPFDQIQLALAEHKPVVAGTRTPTSVGHAYAVVSVNTTSGLRYYQYVVLYDPNGQLVSYSYSEFCRLFYEYDF